MTTTAISSIPEVPAADAAPTSDSLALAHAELEGRIAFARPRLLQLAAFHGVAQDMVEDIVQEALLIAWQRLETLRAPVQLDAWLDGICRNLCLHHHRAVRVRASRQAARRMGLDSSLQDTCTGVLDDIDALADPQADDPLAELTRQDLQTLLDRALGYLPRVSREAVELRYLADLPTSEVATRLGLTINAVDVRLHRARAQLRHTLHHHLRAEAAAYGLSLDEKGLQDEWRETRLWCMFCGRQHLYGRLEELPDGRVNLQLRCQQCSPHIGSPTNGCLTESGPLSMLRGLRTFRPAFRRQQQSAIDYTAAAAIRHVCLWCGASVHSTLTGPDDRPSFLLRWPGLIWVTICPACDWLASMPAGWSGWNHPQAQAFMVRHPHWISEPEKLVDWNGQPAIRVDLADRSSAARLTILLHAEHLHPLATFQA